MSLCRLILRSLAYYWQHHVGLLFGVAIASAVVSGSLTLGDSVTASLQKLEDSRLGRIRDALVAGDRFFTAGLAARLGAGTHVPAILAQGTVSAKGGKIRANQTQVLGVPANFGLLSEAGVPMDLPPGACAVNRNLAQRLGIAPGDTVVIRMEKPSPLPKDAPLSGSADNDITIRKQVTALIDDAHLGGFKLSTDQLPARTVFLPLRDLQSTLALPGKANLLLSTGCTPSLLNNAWTPADFSLTTQLLGDGGLEVKSDRVFLKPAVEQALVDLAPEGAQPVLTYLVNAITSATATGTTPVSMATATRGIVPEGRTGSLLPPAAITQWLAKDRGLAVGDTLTIRYFVVGDRRTLVEASTDLEVTRILAMDAPEVNATWTPEFPGVTGVDNCRDWEPGFAVDLAAIRDKDEAYWDTYRGTPKLFLRPEDGTRFWQNRFGKATSVRFPRAPADLTKALRDRLAPASVGIVIRPLRTDSDAALDDALPLGSYFLYFSWFILMAALILAALLFLFCLESRTRQLGLQKAIGIPLRLTRRAILGEAVLITAAGAFLGMLLGIGYAKACLWGLTHLWQEATGALPFVFHLQPLHVLGGSLAGMLCAFLVVALASRGIFKKTPLQLLIAAANSPLPTSSPAKKHRLSRLAILSPASCVAVASLLGSAALLATSRILSGQALMGAFFAAGTLLLIAGISGLVLILRRLDRPGLPPATITHVGIRNTVRRRGRSLAVAGLIASSVFLVAAVNAFRLNPTHQASLRSSGTGGFAFFGESSLPVYHDLETPEGARAFGFDPEELDAIAVVPLRTLPGEDASCLNLNHAQRPVLLGVDPGSLATREAFTFAGGATTWQSLIGLTAKGHIPAIVDSNTATYALKKKIGDTLAFTDEHGQEFKIELVGTLSNSILQGSVLISEENFILRFPSTPGYRTFLIDVDSAAVDPASISALLTRQLFARGLSLQPASERLAAFHNVQNSYLSIFTALGGLGVVLGTLGLGVVVARHLIERQGELALFRALGFPPWHIRWLVISENIFLLIFGIALGLLSALLSVWPQVVTPGSGMDLPSMALFAAAAFLCGLAAIFAASAKLPKLTAISRSEAP